MDRHAIRHSSSMLRGMQALRLLPARGFAIVLGVAHAAVAGLLWTLPLDGLLLLVLTVIVAAGAIYAIRQHALRLGAHSVLALEFGDRTRCLVGFRNGAWLHASVAGTSTVSRWLTVINLEVESGAKQENGKTIKAEKTIKAGKTVMTHVVIVPGSLDADAYRRLRVWLRFGPQPVKSLPGA